MAELELEFTSVWPLSPGFFYKAMMLLVPWQSTCGYLWGTETKGKVQARKALPKKSDVSMAEAQRGSQCQEER